MTIYRANLHDQAVPAMWPEIMANRFASWDYQQFRFGKIELKVGVLHPAGNFGHIS